MKYTVATIVLGLAGACLLVRWEIKARQAQEHTAASRATLAAATTQELSRRYGECVPRLPDRPLQGDCVEVLRESEARALQVVKIQPLQLPIPVPAPPKLQEIEISVPTMPSPPEPDPNQFRPVSTF